MPITLKEVCLTSGETIDVSDGLTVIVGPNNVGKTLLLSELYSRLRGTNLSRGHLVVDHVGLERNCSLDEIIEWLDSTYGRRKAGTYGEDGYVGEPSYKPQSGQTLTESELRNAWRASGSLGRLTEFMVRHLSAQQRLSIASQSQPLDLHGDRPSNPVQALYMDRELERQASKQMARAFGQALTVDRYAGNQVWLLVGEPSYPETGPPPSREYLSQLASLEKLSEQGDGVRAFMGSTADLVGGLGP